MAPIILVIDDESFTREAIEDILSMIDVVVISVEDGEQGVACFNDKASDIAGVILDVNLEGLSAEETLRQIRALRPDIPVLLSSGFTEVIVRPRFVDQEPVTFLPKPYDMHQLIAEVEALLN